MVSNRKNLQSNKTGPAGVAAVVTQQTRQTTRMNMIRYLKHGGIYTMVLSSLMLRPCHSASAFYRLASTPWMSFLPSVTSTMTHTFRMITTLSLVRTHLHSPSLRGSRVSDAMSFLYPEAGGSFQWNSSRQNIAHRKYTRRGVFWRATSIRQCRAIVQPSDLGSSG